LYDSQDLLGKEIRKVLFKMNEIIKSIVIGILTIAVWLAASVILNDNKNTDSLGYDSIKKQRIFVETLTIDYEGDTRKI